MNEIAVIEKQLIHVATLKLIVPLFMQLISAVYCNLLSANEELNIQLLGI